MDEHDGQDTGLTHGLITHSVIGCAFDEGFIIVPDWPQRVATASSLDD